MKKSKFLGLALAAVITLTGAGYAYWNDGVTTSSIVNTGKVETYFDTTLGVNQNLDVKVDNNIITYATANLQYETVNNVSRSATLTVKNLFPGATVEKELVIANNSTMPLKVTNMGIALSGNTVSVTDLIIKGEFTINNELRTIDNLVDPDQRAEMTAIKIPNLQVGKDMKIKLTISVPYDSTFQDKAVTLGIAPQFTQFNDPVSLTN